MRLITSLSTQGSAPARATARVRDAGPVVLGAWGVALLLRPTRPGARRGDRAVSWYQREVALLNVSHLAETLLCRRAGGAPQVTLPVTALLLSAGHAAEAMRRRAPVHAVAAVAAAGWGLAGARPALARRYPASSARASRNRTTSERSL